MRQALPIVFLSIFFSVATAQTDIGYPTQSIKLLSWNIYMLPGFIGQASMKLERAEIIGKLLSESDYDVIVFQEAFCPQARKKIKQYLEPNFPYLAGPANSKPFSLKVNSGLWIFSKHPIVSTHTIVYKNRTGIDALSRKGAILIALEVNGKQIQVAGTHLQNAGGVDIRHAQCSEFYERLLKPNAKDGVPQILCGDFNINRENQDSYQFMLASLNVKDGDLVSEQKFSYDRLNNDLHVEAGKKQDLIDYVLVRENGAWVTCNNRQVKMLRQRWHKNHQDLSDHFALEAEITFTNNPSIASTRK